MVERDGDKTDLRLKTQGHVEPASVESLLEALPEATLARTAVPCERREVHPVIYCQYQTHCQNEEFLKIFSYNDKIKMHPNALLQTESQMDEWAKSCGIQIINSIIYDLRKHDFEIVKVDGYTSIWDATMYIDTTTLCSSELKLLALYTFAKSGGHILLDGKQIKGDINLITKLIETERITAALAQEFIDDSYIESRTKNYT